MRKMMNKVTGSMKAAAKKAILLMKDTRGENYVDTAVKILIAVYSEHFCWRDSTRCLAMWSCLPLHRGFRRCSITQDSRNVRRIFKVPDKIDIKSVNKDVCKIFNCLYHRTDTAKRKRRK